MWGLVSQVSEASQRALFGADSVQARARIAANFVATALVSQVHP